MISILEGEPIIAPNHRPSWIASREVNNSPRPCSLEAKANFHSEQEKKANANGIALSVFESGLVLSE
jgi:hypothetical protein